MPHYMLNKLGNDWVYEADSEKEATRIYLEQDWNGSLEAYEEHCKDCSCDSYLDWTEVVKLPDGGFQEFEVVHNFMDSRICELINELHAPCSDQEFTDKYCIAHEAIFERELRV